jgi:hypothetical protein
MITINHDCEGPLPGGFFSKLLIVLDWIHNSIYQKEKVKVNWTCLDKLDHNIWDYLFEDPQLDNDETNRTISLFHYRFYHSEYVYSNISDAIPCYHEYGGKFWNNPKIILSEKFQNIRDEYNKSWGKIKLKENVTNNLNQYLDKFGNKTLGVTVRIPLHYTFNKPEGDPISTKMSDEDYYLTIVNEIQEEFEIGGYDKIFVACDIQHFIDLMVNKFGEDKIIFTKYNRIQNLNGDWIGKNLPLKDEYFLILSDALLLSKCNLLMGGSSNIFLGTLFINNKINFKVFNALKETYGC